MIESVGLGGLLPMSMPLVVLVDAIGLHNSAGKLVWSFGNFASVALVVPVVVV